MKSHDRQGFRQIDAFLDLLEQVPGRLGYPLRRELEGYRGAHVGLTDRYRVIWKVTEEEDGISLGAVVVARAARRFDSRRRSLYDEPVDLLSEDPPYTC